MRDILLYTGAAFFEIFGCFAFWNHFRLGKPLWWFPLGTLSLLVFAFLLTQVQVQHAGRAYAIYGGIYIAASLLWLYAVEHQLPDMWDALGAAICIIGALVILYAPH